MFLQAEAEMCSSINTCEVQGARVVGHSLLIGQRGHYKVIVSAQRNSQKLVDVNIGKIHVGFHIIHIGWISGKEIIQSRRKQSQIKNTLVDVLILLLHTALFLQHFF